MLASHAINVQVIYKVWGHAVTRNFQIHGHNDAILCNPRSHMITVNTGAISPWICINQLGVNSEYISAQCHKGHDSLVCVGLS